jgi:hypothetical protein
MPGKYRPDAIVDALKPHHLGPNQHLIRHPLCMTSVASSKHRSAATKRLEDRIPKSLAGAYSQGQVAGRVNVGHHVVGNLTEVDDRLFDESIIHQDCRDRPVTLKGVYLNEDPDGKRLGNFRDGRNR